MMRIKIEQGRVIDPKQQLDKVCDIYIAEQNIIAIDSAPDGFKADTTIDAKDLIVAPGLIELSARLGEPGFEHKGRIESETMAAASAGITQLCCLPDTNPVIDNPTVIELIQNRAKDSNHAEVLALGALTQGLEGKYLSEMAALKAAGCVGMTNAHQPIENSQILRRCLEYASTFDLTVFVQPQNFSLSRGAFIHEGAVSTRLGLSGIPASAETIAVAQYLLLAEEVGARIHFHQLSTGTAVEMVANAKAQGLPVTADVSIYHLLLSDVDIEQYNPNCYLRPPLRDVSDRQALCQGLQNGTIDAISSAHTPHDIAAKLAPLAATEPGISGLETLLPLALKLVADDILDLPQMLSCLSSKPAAIVGRPELGQITVNQSANLCVFDPKLHWTVSRDHWHSQGMNNPFWGWELTAKNRFTILNGELVFSFYPA